MSQRPHLGSIFTSPEETTYLAKLTGHAATTEKREQAPKMHIKLFSTSFNTVLYNHPLSPTQPVGTLNTQPAYVSAVTDHSKSVLV